MARRVIRASAEQRFFSVLLILVALFVFFSLTQDRFFTTENIETLLSGAAILWVVAIGLTFVMLIGGFDLSLGSMLALAGIALGSFINDLGIAVVPAIVMTVALGAALGGGVNGALIGRAGMPFLVVTLGTLILYRGVVNFWSGTKTEQIASPALDALAFNSIVGIPVPVWIMVVTFLVALYLQRSTYFGRDVYAVGGGTEAARVSGIRVSRTIIAVYALAGALAAFGGVLQDARIGAASPMVGDAIIFDAAAAVLLGGTSLAGGVGGVGGTVIGVLFLATLQNGLAVAGVESFWQEIITGAILIAAVALDTVQRNGVFAGALARRTQVRARALEAVE